MMHKKVLLAVDSRENSVGVAKKGFELAAQLQAEVALVFVAGESKNADAGIMAEDILMALKKEAENTLEQLIRVNNQPKETLKFIPEGLPDEEILKTADDWGADIIVMGMHGKNGFILWAMGSTTQHIILHSKIPVIVVPAQEQ